MSIKTLISILLKEITLDKLQNSKCFMKNFLLLCFTITLFAACGGDNSETIKKQLVGEWSINAATINGNDGLELLSGTQFAFDEASIQSNLLPLLGMDIEKAPYTVSNQVIQINDDIKFAIKEISDETMTITFEFTPEGAPLSKYELQLVK
jgi:hypothetical protein